MTFTAQDMVHAMETQSAALPVPPPTMRGLDIAILAVSAQGIGGDFHLVFSPVDSRREPNLLGVALGDVAGKGLPAALTATSIGHLLPWLDPLADPTHALRALNWELLERTPTESYASMVLAEIDTGRGTLRLWSAGQPPALLWRAQMGSVQASSVQNFPLGCFPDWRGEPEEWYWDTGDVLVLYSDGLIETRNGKGDFFGVEGLVNVLRCCGEQDVDKIARAIQDSAGAWGAIKDDTTVIVCRRTALPTLPTPVDKLMNENADNARRSLLAPPTPVRVLLVDDHDIWRQGMRSVLEDSEFIVVGEAASGNEAPEAVIRTRPDLVLLDIRMADGDGFAALRAIKAQTSSTPEVVMLTTYGQPGYMALARADGAAGYLLKGTPRDEMLASLRAVMSGKKLTEGGGISSRGL